MKTSIAHIREAVLLYNRKDVFGMFRSVDEEKNTAVFGRHEQEEAYGYAPLVLRPQNKSQLRFLIQLLEIFLEIFSSWTQCSSMVLTCCLFAPSGVFIVLRVLGVDGAVYSLQLFEFVGSK
jgi:hypothetical protein